MTKFDLTTTLAYQGYSSSIKDYILAIEAAEIPGVTVTLTEKDMFGHPYYTAEIEIESAEGIMQIARLLDKEVALYVENGVDTLEIIDAVWD